MRDASENQGIRYGDQYQGLEYVSENQGTRYGNQHQGMRYPNQHQGMRHDSEHEGVTYTNQHQDMGYATYAANQQTNNTGPNDYYKQIVNLNTLHKNFMHETRRYQISVHRGHYSFAQHHFIVVSDGMNKDITLELTVGGGVSTVLSSQENVIAKVNIFQGSKDDLDNKGVLDCTLYKLTEIAAAIIRENPYYNLLTNNCQTFCNKFLDKLELKTYMTDQEKGTSTGFSILGGSASTSASK